MMKLHVVRLGVAVWAALFFCAVSWGQLPPVRIMPIGDSITCGSSLAGGYRLPLWGLLTNLGYSVDYVGTNAAACYSASLPDANHQGHSGWRINQIDVQLLQNFGVIEDPDVILIMIGTNDFGGDDDLPNATNRLDRLIGKIVTNRPHCKVLVASLTPRGPAALEANIQTNFNNSVPVIVAKYAAEGGQVYFVDMHEGVAITNMAEAAPNQLHPNAAGYLQMATNWLPAITNVISPLGTTNAPVVARVVMTASSWSNAVVTFSKPVSDETATNIANYFLGSGAVLDASLDATNKRTVTLLITEMPPLTTNTMVVVGVKDRTAAETEIVAAATDFVSAGTNVPYVSTYTNFGTGPVVTSGAFVNVPGIENYQLVHSVNLPNSASWSSAAYDVDLKAYVSNFSRVAYYMELQTNGGAYEFAWVEFDPMTANAGRIGVPTVASGASFQQPITNLTVLCTATSVVVGTNMSGGNIEFWPSNYGPLNTLFVQNASDTAYDWGDQSTGGNYGSMQVHHSSESRVIFAFNRWGGIGGNVELGIGNRPGTADVDWTFAQNASGYVTKRLQVFVLSTNFNAPAIAAAAAVGSSVVLTFSAMLHDDATNPANYSISGVTVTGATLDPATRAQVTLTTTPALLGLTAYTVTVNNVHGLSTNSGVIATNSTAVFTNGAVNGALNNVPESTNYHLVHSIQLAVNAAFPTVATYDADLRGWATNFSRVAYYMELQAAGGAPNFIWTSFDPVTTNVNRIGIPTYSSGAVFQQPITNLNVFCSVTGVVTGTGMSGGNIEFWPNDYGAANTVAVPNASPTNYDFGDSRSAGGGYGSMQVHNHDAVLGTSTGQVLFAFNRWGNTPQTTDIGIGNRPGSNDKDWTFAQTASTYTSRILQVYVLPLTNLPPVVADVAGQPNLSNVVVLFSKQVTDSAATLTNFSIAGLTIYSAVLDPVSRSRVTLTTAPQTPSTLYTLTLGGGVSDSTPENLPLSGGPTYPFMSVARSGALNNVPEAAGWTLVYSLNIPNTANYSATTPAYSVDNRFAATNYSRIAYYLELVKPGGLTNFIWASMDAFAADAGKIGVPVNASGASFQQPVTNLTVISSVFGVLSGTNMGGGNIEFWPNSYQASNIAGVANASDLVNDWGDRTTVGNYGSMQIHNSAASQVLFALNNWGGGGTLDLGIGNNILNANPDWTFMNNANTYTTKVLQVYVLPIPDATAPTILSAIASPDRTRVVVTFSEPLADGAASLANYAIDNGSVISAASLSNNLRQVVLTVSQLAGGATYTLTVNNVRDRSANANVIAANTQIVIAAPAMPAQILANAPEAAAYQLAYTLNVPNIATNWNVNGTPYATDNRNLIGPYDRVAYYMELATNAGPTNWVWVSMDSFTSDVNKIAVPDMALAGGPIIQRRVSNLTVLASMTNIVSGTNLATGNIEFWPYNYGGANAIAIPGASAAANDFGDQVSLTYGLSGHACMQVHNWGATQTVFALNRWGGNGNVMELGIGNDPNPARGSYSPDWTFATNSVTYTTKNLYVLVRPFSDTNGPLVSRVQNTPDLTRVLVTFNQPLDEVSAAATNFAIAGLTVNTATLGTNLHDIVLGTSPQTADTTYTLTISNVRDRTTNSTLIAAPIATNFTAFSPAAINALIPETTNLTLVYGLALPDAAPNYNSNGIPYTVDLRPLITQNFNRVAYYMELATNGGTTNWVYLSSTAFNTNINRIGIPVLGSGAGFQQKLATNATVLSSDLTIATGTVNTLSIEFWPFNSSAATTTIVTGGSPLHFDWNDTYNTGGQYGSMQIHNWSAGHTLFAFNRWGGGQTSTCDIGIGNAPGTTNTDWTFAQNATNHVTKNLYIFVRLTNAPAPAAPPAPVAPVLVTQPTSRTNVQNTSAILAALAIGTGPITYQWRKSGTPISGMTNSWLTFPSVQLTDAGTYDLLASNTAGTATSLVAVLSVTNPPPPPSGYDTWAAQITNGLTNATDSALGDGYPNLLKYATGSNPTNADTLAHLHATRTNGILALRFNHDTNATDITLIIEGANTVTNGTDWHGLATNTGGTWGTATNVTENTATQPATVTVTDTAPPATNRFLRLRVTRP